jgi:hypothetical protein
MLVGQAPRQAPDPEGEGDGQDRREEQGGPLCLTPGFRVGDHLVPELRPIANRPPQNRFLCVDTPYLSVVDLG